jgi:hypothetical protein
MGLILWGIIFCGVGAFWGVLYLIYAFKAKILNKNI